MASNNLRKRGGSFHVDRDSEDNDSSGTNDVQFMTPYYDDGNIPEPLDLSKLCLDDEDDMEEPDKEGDMVVNRIEDTPTRGRTRSRSVHENDLNVSGFVPAGVLDANSHTPESEESGSGSGSGSANSTRRSGGPLQHREVQALKKGLEEANQSLNKTNQNREDEEERMAADAEKRKRLLLLSNSSLSAGSDAPVTRRVKILMLGDSGVGKSSLIMRWTMDTFSPSLTSTVGVNFKSRKVNVANETMQVQVWDTAGQEQFHKITTSYYKGAQGIMLVYDVTDRRSMENVHYWVKNIKSHASDTVQVALIGNKTDIRASGGEAAEHCSTEKGQEIATKFGIPFFETSAKDSFNVAIGFLTLVEHIVESSEGPRNSVAGPGSSTSSPNNIPGGGLSAPQYRQPSTHGLAQDRRSIVEKAEKNSVLGSIKRTIAGSSAPTPAPQKSTGVPLGRNSAEAADSTTSAGATGKDKCSIS
eukprot:CAMPEP_0173269620 /NCGR_PEP_ID=MMETSP1142-20121109/30976_1 /TAXON_ID=483371 /ORGANISM="non described non described, Strain CCMP2298" /LENGTH=471 /DNA_ID=CAMNT_0014205979 /DNA_START=162 /DNA_END=1577 /DNA_ORIENTATION=+